MAWNNLFSVTFRELIGLLQMVCAWNFFWVLPKDSSKVGATRKFSTQILLCLFFHIVAHPPGPHLGTEASHYLAVSVVSYFLHGVWLSRVSKRNYQQVKTSPRADRASDLLWKAVSELASIQFCLLLQDVHSHSENHLWDAGHYYGHILKIQSATTPRSD